MTYYVRYQGGLANGEQWVTGIHLNTGGTLDLVAATMDDAFNAFWDTVKASIPASTTVVGSVAYTLDAGTGKATARAAGTLTHTGESAVDAVPNAVAVVASLRTATPGPRGRGRMYWPAPDEDAFGTDGLIVSGVAADFATGTQAMLDVFTGSSLDPCLFTKGAANRLITSCDVSEVSGVQRRRRNKIIAPRHIG